MTEPRWTEAQIRAAFDKVLGPQFAPTASLPSELIDTLAAGGAATPAEGYAEFQVREVAETIRDFTRRDKPPKPPGFTDDEWDRHCGLIAATAETFRAALKRGYDKWADQPSAGRATQGAGWTITHGAHDGPGTFVSGDPATQGATGHEYLPLYAHRDYCGEVEPNGWRCGRWETDPIHGGSPT